MARGTARSAVRRAAQVRTAATNTTCRAHSEEVARAIAARHGVGAEDFGLYPAYSAIVDSVLKGARLPLAEATAVEMDQFLRLMFSPVAGRMVRTLFLERLRAERELAAPAGAAHRAAGRRPDQRRAQRLGRGARQGQAAAGRR